MIFITLQKRTITLKRTVKTACRIHLDAMTGSTMWVFVNNVKSLARVRIAGWFISSDNEYSIFNMGTVKKQKQIKELSHCNKPKITDIFNQVIYDLTIGKKEELINYLMLPFFFVVIFVVFHHWNYRIAIWILKHLMMKWAYSDRKFDWILIWILVFSNRNIF